ncbi:MAG: cytochrome c maturation protein CcmE [Fidelibacterota bacterium]
MKLRSKFPVVIIAVAFLLILWVAMGFEGNEMPYVTIQELKETQPPRPDKRLRLGGNVKEGSIVRDTDNPLNLAFDLKQGDQTLLVTYNKIVPDMFKDGAEVIVEGYYVEGTLRADNLMTKCASRYEGDLRDADRMN